MGIWFEILLIVLLILLNGVFSLAEMSIVSSRKARLRHAAEEGHWTARVAFETAENPARFLSTVQVGITLIGILAGALGSASLLDELKIWLQQFPILLGWYDVLAIGIIVTITTFASVVFGELIPKTIALQQPEKWAAVFAFPMKLVAQVFTPIVSLFTITTEGLLRLFGLKGGQDPQVTGEEIQILLRQGAESGALHQTEGDMAEAVLALADQRVSTIMRHRMDIVFLEWDADLATVIRTLTDYSQFTEIPVCRKGLDDLMGFIVTKQVLLALVNRTYKGLGEWIKSAYYLPESINCLRALNLMKEKRMKTALILDEYGGVKGLVSLTDLTKTVFGDLRFLPGEEVMPSLPVPRADGTYVLPGSLPLEDFLGLFPLILSKPQRRCATLSGLLMELFDKIPEPGDVLEWQALHIQVWSMDGRRVDQVNVLPHKNIKVPKDEMALS